MKNKQKLEKVFTHNYREFIEFINNLYVPHRIKLILIYMPLVVIFGDLLADVGEDQFWGNMAKFTFSQLLFDLMQSIHWLMPLIQSVILFLLLLPPLLALIIFVWSCALVDKDELQIGYFTQSYCRLWGFRLVRVYIHGYQRLIYPIIISVGVKMVHKSPAISIVIIILSFINSVIYHYYNLEIPFAKKKYPLSQISFNNSLLESVLLAVTLILINVTHGIAPFICAVGIGLARALVAIFLPYEVQIYRNQQTFSQLVLICTATALCIGASMQEIFILSFCAAIAVGAMVVGRGVHSNLSRNVNPNISQTGYTELSNRVQQTQNQMQITIESIKRDLLDQKITKSYRNAVLLSRTKKSHRQQLIIDVLKNKAYQLQRVSRGSIKTANSLDLLSYESRVLKIITNILEIESKAIQALTLMKNKQPKQQMLVKIVTELVRGIQENKVQVGKCLEINCIGGQIRILMQLIFRKLYNDTTFIRETKTKIQQQNLSINHRMIQKQLFNKDKALMVINVLDQVGKISRVSNNLPNVLGYTSQSLIGSSVNQLIPFTVRKRHDQILTNFVQNFSSEIARKKPYVEFYAYDKSFHLQKVQIKYKFFLHYFKNFQLSGIIHKAKTQDYLIITDEFGNIQGWSAKVGELFNFDEIAGNDCCVYNLLPLIPACVKFDHTKPICLKSIIFRLSKMKTSKLMLFDLKKGVPATDEMKKKQNQAFYDIFQSGQFLEGFVANIQIDPITFGGFKKIIKLFKFYQLRRIENLQVLQDILLFNEKQIKKSELGNRLHQNYPVNQKSIDQSEDGEYSIDKNTNHQNYRIDLNFSLQIDKPTEIDYTILKFSKDLDRFQSTFFSRSLLKVQFDEDKKNAEVISENLAIESTFDPRLERHPNYTWIVIIVSLGFLGIMVSDLVLTSRIFNKLQTNKQEIKKANIAQMIYCKTVFNPNETYIQKFKNGNLLFFNNWLINQNSTYITFDEKKINQNLFYQLNVQVPSTLERIVRLEENKYVKQLQLNFKKVIQNYQITFAKFKDEWSRQTDSVRNQTILTTSILSFGTLIYLSFILFIYRRYKNQMKMTQAFFKFKKTDLEERISSLKSIGILLQKRCEQWNIEQSGNKIQRKDPPYQPDPNPQTKKEIANSISLKSIRVKDRQKQLKQKQTNKNETEIETEIQRKRMYLFIGIVFVVLLLQSVFLILQGVYSGKLQNDLKNDIEVVDKANKLAVYPNLKIASLWYEAPQQIVNKYQRQVDEILGSSAGLIPQFYEKLREAPCSDCNFLREILITNYRSFYSYFSNTISTMTKQSKIQDMFYGVDVVVEQISPFFDTVQIQWHYLLWMIYVFSLIFFFVCVLYVLWELEEKCAKLQCFLKFFSIQTLMKNKHMSTVMAKNM